MAQERVKTALFAEERRHRIAELVNEKKTVSVDELCLLFNASPATIRTDLNELSCAGLLCRTHGGAVSVQGVSYENLKRSVVTCLNEKKAIAEKALGLIFDHDTVLLDAGSTTLELARLLSQRSGLTVIVNDINIASVLESTTDATIVFLGGILRRGIHSCVGPAAEKALAEMHIDKAFLGANGLSAEGATTPDPYQAQVKHMMVERARQAVLLADSTKLGKLSFCRFSQLSEFERLITDDGAAEEALKEIQETGIIIDIAKRQ